MDVSSLFLKRMIKQVSVILHIERSINNKLLFNVWVYGIIGCNNSLVIVFFRMLGRW